MSNVPLLIKMLALRAWLALTALWIIGTIVTIILARVGWDQFASLPYLGFVFGPPIAVFAIWHILAWIISPMLPEQGSVPLPQDYDFMWRVGVFQNLQIVGGLASPLVALWLCAGWPIWAGYRLYRHGSDENQIWFGVAFFLGPLLWVLLVYLGKQFLLWVLPEATMGMMARDAEGDRS